MARRPSRQPNNYNRYVSGNLAYDYDYLERERRRHAEREQQEYAERRARETTVRTAPRSKPVVKHRPRQRVSPVAVLGAVVMAVMLVMLLLSYAQLTAVSHNVVTMQSALSALEDEHVSLLSRYERTFDLAAIKEAAEAAGMAKPSASQIYYVDLSAPDSVVLYRDADKTALGRVFTAVKQSATSVVEYFK